MKNLEILTVNPAHSEMNVMLDITLNAIENEQTVRVYKNNEKLNEFDIPKTKTQIKVKNLILQPGVNVITLDSDEFVLTESKREISFVVESIAIMN